ncbi:patatin-like phospholipase family protein [candidate division KSB1 bacterium]|nr:patatin-like phospholipase family protein [candidate division KSB1 bacterium]
MSKINIGLVLGSGAARGLSHIGILKVIERIGIPIDIIVGTSMGAIIGGAYAAGISLQEMERAFCDINWFQILKMIAPSRLQLQGLFDGENIKDFMKSRFGDHIIEQLDKKFACVATDFHSGEEIVLEKGSLIDALRASMSIPLFFSPVKINGQYLVDGGVVNPVPIDIARKLGADIVIAVVVTRNINQFTAKINQQNASVVYTPVPGSQFDQLSSDLSINTTLIEEKNQENKKSFKENSIALTQHMNRVSIIMANTLLNLRLDSSPPDILIRPNTDQYKLTDFTRAKELITVGEQAAELVLSRELIEKLKKRVTYHSFIRHFIPKMIRL